MKNKKMILISAITTVSLLAGGLIASAQSVTTTTSNPAPTSEMSVTLNRMGNGLIEGTLASVGSNSITVNSWGGSWTVNVDPSTEVIEHYGHPAQLSDFQIGDYIRADVSAATNASWTLNASVVRDVTLQYAFGTFNGSITAINGNSLTFQSVERGAITVNLAPGTQVFIGGASSSSSALMDGMTGSIFGNWDRANTNLSAVIVRVRGVTSTSTPAAQ